MKLNMKLMGMVAIAVTIGMVCSLWADTETVGDYTWTYRINGDTAEIYKGSQSSAISPSPAGMVAIPSSLGGKPVTRIGEYAFNGYTNLTTVVIPESVTEIGQGAFENCMSLEECSIPDGVTNIGKWAF